MAATKRETPAKKPARKSTKAQPPVKRLEYVEELLGQGQRYTDVVARAMARFGCSKRTAERDAERIYAKWETDEPERRIALRAKMRHRLERLYAIASGDETREVVTRSGDVVEVSSVDLQAAVRLLDRMAKLDGLDCPVEARIDLSAKLGHDARAAAMVKEMLPAERERRIVELEAIRAAEQAKDRKGTR